MPVSTSRVAPLILDELARGERRLLSLVVAVGKVLESTDRMKGNLTTTIRSALRRLVASKMVVDADGMYSLPARK